MSGARDCRDCRRSEAEGRQVSGRRPQGAQWFRDAEGRITTNYARNTAGEIVPWNPIQQEKDRGTPVFSTGHTQSYHVALSGGRDQLTYYLSGTYNDDEGNAYGRLGEVLSRLGRKDEARAAYETGVRQAEKHGHSGMAEDLRLAIIQLGE
jgi:hypothetical protein